MNSNLIGGILLVVGTTIGAGMLALPVATAALGFWGSVILLFACWGVMTACAFLFLEVNLWLPANTNLISMAGATLGRGGQAIAWVVYLFLLYSILSAYIAGGGDLFHYILNSAGFEIPLSFAAILFTVLFGSVVYFGIRSVDYVNRGLMFGKLGAYALLVIFIFPFINPNYLNAGEMKYIISPTSLTVTTVAFGCLMIVPSLRTYFGEDIKSLRLAILIGTLIPLVCYIGWDMVVMGVIPLGGDHGLQNIIHSPNANSDVVKALSEKVQNYWVTALIKFFTSICMATSFLSVSLCLSDFLSDGFKITKNGFGNLLIFSITFLPPLLIVLFYPDAFIRGLSYAGVSCFVLMILMPPLMVWRGRYHLDYESTLYQVPANKFALALIVLFALLMIIFGIGSKA